ncbi:MAG: hypothetical protein ACKPKO_20915, partial [Candidatus Fonsibacter sp.]
MPLLLRMVDPEELSKYDCMTPTALDYLADYLDGIQRMVWQLDVSNAVDAGIATTPTIYYAGDAQQEATGSRPYGIRPTCYKSCANNILAYYMNRPAGTAYYHKPRGSWLIK